MLKLTTPKLKFRARFRRGAFRWKSQLAKMTTLDVVNAYSFTLRAPENAACADVERQRIGEIASQEALGERFVTRGFGPRLGVS